MTEAELIDDIFNREGRTYAEQPKTDQPTGSGGIIAATLADYLGVDVKTITREQLKALTVKTSTPIIQWKLNKLAVDAQFDLIQFTPLRLQMIDFAYNSGTERAVRWLQRVVGIPESQVTGKFNPQTWIAMSKMSPVIMNNALAASRARAALQGGVKDVKLRNGVALRAISFVLPLV